MMHLFKDLLVVFSMLEMGVTLRSWWELREGILQWRDTGCSGKTGILTNVP